MSVKWRPPFAATFGLTDGEHVGHAVPFKERHFSVNLTLGWLRPVFPVQRGSRFLWNTHDSHCVFHRFRTLACLQGSTARLTRQGSWPLWRWKEDFFSGNSAGRPWVGPRLGTCTVNGEDRRILCRETILHHPPCQAEKRRLCVSSDGAVQPEERPEHSGKSFFCYKSYGRQGENCCTGVESKRSILPPNVCNMSTQKSNVCHMQDEGELSRVEGFYLAWPGSTGQNAIKDVKKRHISWIWISQSIVVVAQCVVVYWLYYKALWTFVGTRRPCTAGIATDQCGHIGCFGYFQEEIIRGGKSTEKLYKYCYNA